MREMTEFVRNHTREPLPDFDPIRGAVAFHPSL
jgi:hypothetical protein